jgi:hypothetical protein
MVRTEHGRHQYAAIAGIPIQFVLAKAVCLIYTRMIQLILAFLVVGFFSGEGCRNEEGPASRRWFLMASCSGSTEFLEQWGDTTRKNMAKTVTHRVQRGIQ